MRSHQIPPQLTRAAARFENLGWASSSHAPNFSRKAAFLLFATPCFQDQDNASQPHDREAVEYVQESGFSEGGLAAYEKYWDGVSAEGELLGQQKAALKMLRKGRGIESEGSGIIF
jgi:hypothetical protein